MSWFCSSVQEMFIFVAEVTTLSVSMGSKEGSWAIFPKYFPIVKNFLLVIRQFQISNFCLKTPIFKGLWHILIQKPCFWSSSTILSCTMHCKTTATGPFLHTWKNKTKKQGVQINHDVYTYLYVPAHCIPFFKCFLTRQRKTWLETLDS